MRRAVSSLAAAGLGQGLIGTVWTGPAWAQGQTPAGEAVTALWAIAVILAVGFLTAALGLYYIWHALKETRKAVRGAARVSRDAGEAAAAVKQVVSKARQEREVEQRAYLGAMGATIELTDRPMVKGHIVFKNTGQSPARDVEFRCSFGASAQSRPDSFPEPRTNPAERSRSVMLPGMQTKQVTELGAIEINEEFLRALHREEMHIFYYGRILYVDIYGASQETKFRFQFTGPLQTGRPLSMWASAEGNEIS